MRTARVEFLNALQADPDDKAARIMQARVQLALGDGVAAESEIVRARQSGVPGRQTAHLLAHAQTAAGRCRAPRCAEAAGAAPAHEAYAARIRGRAYMALGDNGEARAAFDRALAVAPNDSEVWTDVARFRRASGDVAGRDRGQPTARSRATAAQRRGAGPARRTHPRPIWPRRRFALVRPRARGRSGQCRRLARAGDHLWRHGPDDRHARRRARGASPDRRPSDALIICRRCSPPARAISSRPKRSGTAPAAPSTTRPPACCCSPRSISRPAMRSRRRGGSPASSPSSRATAAPAACSPPRNGAWAMPPAPSRRLRPIADLPDADAYSLSLIGRALERQGDTIAASLYFARAARPQPGALAALDPLSDGEFAAGPRAPPTTDPGDGPAQVRLISALLARGEGDEALAARPPAAGGQSRARPRSISWSATRSASRGDFAGAVQHYRRAANLAFTEGVAMRLIEALQRSGQGQAADNVLRLFVAQNPRNVPALVMLAGREMQAANWPAAIAIYEGLRQRLGNNDATILNNLAVAYSESGDLERAVPLARRAWALDRGQSGDRRHAGLAAVQERPPRRGPRLARTGRPRRPRRRRDPAPAGAGAAGLAQTPRRSRFSSASGITVTVAPVARSRSTNCAASPTITTVAPSGSSAPPPRPAPRPGSPRARRADSARSPPGRCRVST